MNQETTAFTVFTDEEGFAPSSGARVKTLEELIQWYAVRPHYGRPIAWAAAWPDSCGGTKHWTELRAESIEAGRVIKIIDGKYVAFGQHKPGNCPGCAECNPPIAPTFYCAAETLNPPDPVADECAEPEKVRPALDWANSKPFNKFRDLKGWSYSVSSDTATPDHAYSHPLTRVADAGAQVSAQHGSAHLVR